MNTKKIIVFIFTIFTVFSLSGCNTEEVSIKENLMENNWQVVSEKGQAYEADFQDEYVITNWLGMQQGQIYEVNEEDKTITLFVDINGKQTEDSVYQVVQEEDKFNFISNDDDTKNQYGDLTLTPLEDETKETGQSQ